MLLSLSYDEAAFEILEQLPPAEKNPRTDYLSAIALSRMNRPREGLEYYLKAIQADPVLKFRGNLDPEIQILYKQNNVKSILVRWNYKPYKIRSTRSVDSR